MNIIVVGSGGREHTICWKLAQSSVVDKIVVVPGNGGTANEAKCVNVNPKDCDYIKEGENPYAAIAKHENCRMAVIGPEDPLADGIADAFWAADIPCVGPKKAGAQLEASKDLSKNFMKKYGVACPASETFTNKDEAIKYIKEHGAPIVVKADGLAAGKGVVVAATVEQALEAVVVKGNEVYTSWAGAAGAGVGVAACLAQAPGVLRTEYASEDDLKVGGARICRSTIVLPKYEKITFGIDDTDTKEGGATWVLALKCGEGCPVKGAIFLSMRIIQLNPKAPNKTTNCTGSVITFAVLPEKKEELIHYVKTYVEANAVSGESGICYYEGLIIPKSDFKNRVKTELLTREYAEVEAEKIGVTYVDSARGKGRIGSLGALLWANDGVEAAGLAGEHP